MPAKAEENHAITNARAWYATIADLVRRLESEDANISDAAREEIQEGPLSVMVRNGWREPGILPVPHRDSPEEYEILLSTGGPALRVVGQLDDYCQPYTAELQWQDWGTPWTHYLCDEAALLAYAACFWFGE